jgi:hypothetical protein
LVVGCKATAASSVERVVRTRDKIARRIIPLVLLQSVRQTTDDC